VCLDQPALSEAIDIVGAPEVLVSVSSDRRQANIAIRLCDVHPDGASELISYGVLNLTHRNSHEFPQAMVPGETVTARVVLDQCAYRVPAGHRLRIAVSNAYWPIIWPSPEAVRLELSAATLLVPLRPLAQGDEVTFPAPESASPWVTEKIRAASSERHSDSDEKTGTVTVFISTISAKCAMSIMACQWRHCA
jgi:predicted acyl esterase